MRPILVGEVHMMLGMCSRALHDMSEEANLPPHGDSFALAAEKVEEAYEEIRSRVPGNEEES